MAFEVPDVPRNKTGGTRNMLFYRRDDQCITETGFSRDDIKEISSVEGWERAFKGTVWQNIDIVVLRKILKHLL
jgi:hypothetical protein